MADDKKKPVAAAPEKYDPTAGMTKTELFFAGMGKAVYDTGRFFGNLVGVVSDKEIEEAKRLDEALMKHDAAKVGVAAGYVATSVGGVGAARGVAAAAVKVGVTAAKAVRAGAVVGAMEAAEKGVDVTLKHVAKGTAKVAASATKEAAGAAVKVAAKAAPVVAGGTATLAAAGYAALEADQKKQQLSNEDRETITSVGADAKVIDAKLERENNAEMMTNVTAATATTWGVAKTVGWGLSKITGPIGKVAYVVVNAAAKTAGFGAVTAGSAAATEAISDGAAAAVEQTGSTMEGAEATVAAAGVAAVGAAAAVPKVRSKVIERVADVAKNFKSAGWVGKAMALGGVALTAYNVAAPVVELEEGVEKRLAEKREIEKVAAAAAQQAAPAPVAEAPAAAEPAATVVAAAPAAKPAVKPAPAKPHHPAPAATTHAAARPPEAFNPIAEAPAVLDAGLGFRFPEGSFDRFELAAPVAPAEVVAAAPATSFDSFGTPVPVGTAAATQAVPPTSVMAGDPYHTAPDEKVELGQLRESLQDEPQKMALNTVTNRPPSQNMA